ncbi:MAG: DnaA N-terminal domain-containing protein [Verrucomicrobiota bacterium]
MKKNNNKLTIKEDMNFLEYPTWKVSRKDNSKTLTMKKENGTYEIKTSEDRLPDGFDRIVLYYLLHKLYTTTNGKFDSLKIPATSYEIAKNIYPDMKKTGKREYDRIMTTLKRWVGVTVKFDGIFYDGDGHTTRLFGIIDSIIFDKETKKFRKIRFSPEYIEQLQRTNFFISLNFNDIIKLPDPIALRLYEIQSKNFLRGTMFKIGVRKLGEKLTLSCKYPSQIAREAKSAVDRTNEALGLNTEFEYDPDTEQCTFRKLKPVKEATKPAKALPEPSAHTEEPENPNLKQLLSLLPTALKEQKSVRDSISQYLKDKDYAYVKSNIIYTTRNAKDNPKVFLMKALQGDWGQELRAEQQAREIEKAESQKKASAEIEQQKLEAEKASEQARLDLQARKALYNNPNQAEYDALWEKVTARLEKEIPCQSFTMWIKPQFIAKIDGNTIYIDVPNTFVMNWLTKNYALNLKNTFTDITSKETNIRFSIGNQQMPDANSEPTPQAEKKTGKTTRREKIRTRQ